MTTVLLDLDGVVRHFDPAHVASVEERHGLSNGILTATAFEPELVGRVVTGGFRRIDWVQEVGDWVSNPIAANEWMADHGAVDESMLAEVDALRSQGVVVAVLTNGTGHWIVPDAGKIPFGEYAERWIAERPVRPRTREIYEGQLRHIVAMFAKVNPCHHPWRVSTRTRTTSRSGSSMPTVLRSPTGRSPTRAPATAKRSI